jgi:hypothetical protein
MRIDLDRARYSHCEHPGLHLQPPPDGLDPCPVPAQLLALLEPLCARIVGARLRPTRLVTYLQGAVTLLDHDDEFRAHLWFDLPDGHPGFRGADRGLAWILRPVRADGLYGPTVGGLGWLGRPLPARLRLPEDDWVSAMIQRQGYLDVPGSEWQEPLDDPNAQGVLAGLLGAHLRGMTNHVILEERLGWS